MGKLSKDERAELEKRLADDDATEEDDFEVEIGSEGNYARVPYRKGRSWLQKTFGIDLDPEPDETEKQDEEPKGKPKPAARAVQFGRRVG